MTEPVVWTDADVVHLLSVFSVGLVQVVIALTALVVGARVLRELLR